jgi:hypothetical protein
MIEAQNIIYKLQKVHDMSIIFLQKPFLVFALMYSISIGYFDQNPFFMLMFFSGGYFIFVGCVFLLCQKNLFFSNMQKENPSLLSAKQAKSFIQLQAIKSCTGTKVIIFKCFSHKNFEGNDSLFNDLLVFLNRRKNSKEHYMLDFDSAVLLEEESFYSFIEYVTQDERKLEQLVFNMPYSILCSFYEKISLLAKIGLNFNVSHIDEQGINALLEKKPLFPIFSMEFSKKQLVDLSKDGLFNERFYNLHNHAKYFIASDIEQKVDLEVLPAIIDCAYGPFIENAKTVGIENEVPHRESKTVRPY